MNISELMEQYAQAVAKYEKCETIVKTAHNEYLHAVGSVDESFYTLLNDGTMGHDFEMEMKWNKEIPEREKKEMEAKKELEQARKNLDFIHKSYTLACENMNSYDAMQNHSIAEKKYVALKEKYDGLSELRESSNRTAKKYDEDYGYSKAAPFYSTGTECYYKMQEIEPIMRVYQSFAHNLKFLADKKQNDEYGPKSQINR